MIVTLQTRYQIEQEEIEHNYRQRRMWSWAVGIAALMGACLLLFTGCTSNPAMSHAAFRASVTLGEQIGLSTHPEATPYVRAAVPVVCSVANGTNVTPAEIVKALEKANVTNSTAILIINGGISLLDVVVAGLGTNQTEIRAYGQDLCVAMQAGLPPESAKMARMAKPLPPHLDKH